MRDKYCLESVLPFQSINNDSLNRSISKQTHAFARAPRFATINPNCPINTYGSKPLTRKYSGISIGSGQKSDFTKDLARSPGSSRYNIRGIFDQNKSKHKGHTLSLSREQLHFDSYLPPQRKVGPGVGRYHLQTQTSVRNQRAPKFSLRPKTKVLNLKQSIYAQNMNPSPSDYNNNPETSALLSSRLKRMGCASSRAKRFADQCNKVPGPGQYQNKTNLSNVGKYLVSRYKGGTNAKFDNSKRITKFDQSQRASSQRPGPGSYRVSSEFGQYDGDVYGEKIKNKYSRYGK